MVQSDNHDHVGRVPSPGACVCSLSRCLFGVAMLALALGAVPTVKGIMAGGETALPPDSPSSRLDPLGTASPFNAVGALAINSGGFNYQGSGVALSPNWVLTAGHNLDLNDNGLPDLGLAISFNLPGFGAYSASGFYMCPGFTGFGNWAGCLRLPRLGARFDPPAGGADPARSGRESFLGAGRAPKYFDLARNFP